MLLSVIFAFSGALLGFWVAKVAAWRASRQPLYFDIDKERDVLACALQHPAEVAKILELQPAHFVDAEHEQLWATILDACNDVTRLQPDATEEQQQLAGAQVPADLAERAAVAHSALVTSLLQRPVEPKSGLNAAQFVYDTGVDRLTYPGNSPIERGGPGEAALVRRYRRPTAGRTAAAMLFTAAGAAVTPLLAESVWDQGLPYLLAMISLTLLTIGSVIWALVDQDTMLIDFETFFPFAGAAWAFALAADIAGGEPLRALQGFLLSIFIAAAFRGLNALYRRYKQATSGQGVDGMGGGDSWLVAATAGVPAALAGQLNLWYLCAMAGMVVAVAVWLVRYPTRWRISRETPFAFGPYLALGWILGSALYVAGFQIW